MKVYSITITILFLISLGVILWPEPTTSEKELLNQRDNARIKAKRLEASQDLLQLQVDKLITRINDSKALVKRSEEKLSQAKVNEKVYLKRIKTLTLFLTDDQADSVIKDRFKDDPDSIEQKTIFEFARLDACDSLVKSQDSTLNAYRNQTIVTDSLLSTQQRMLSLSKYQINFLTSALSQDTKILEVKDKRLRKQGKKINVLGVCVPVALVVGLLVGL